MGCCNRMAECSNNDTVALIIADCIGLVDKRKEKLLLVLLLQPHSGGS